MEALGVAAILCGTALYITRLFLPLVKQSVETRANAPMRDVVPVPNDLLLAASKWHDAWAREQALRHIQELYEATGDWERVRYVYSQQDLGEGGDS